MAAEADNAFHRRLLKRRELWWGNPFRWRRWRSYPEALHRFRERRTFRDATDADPKWRCCESWQRSLVNKWNGREFARRYGARLPELYWRGQDPRGIPFASLPPQFVIRPVWGTRRHGVHVVTDATELLRGDPAGPADLLPRLQSERSWRRPRPFLVEEFVRTEQGEYRLPLEYKCHTFGDTVVAVQVIVRTGRITGTHRYYTPRWEPFEDDMDHAKSLTEVMPPPACLDEMLDVARRLGGAIGTYMRIDFFSSDRGCVFNEFSSTPEVRTLKYTPYCNAMFEGFWREKFPQAT